jgi:hypothetical protein
VAPIRSRNLIEEGPLRCAVRIHDKKACSLTSRRNPAFRRIIRCDPSVPGLALILHLVGRGTGPVSEKATLQALAWAEFLEGHAMRAYASVLSPSSIGKGDHWAHP